MTDNAGALCLLNGTIESSYKLDQITMPAEGVVYEVIRVIEKVPVFFEDHFLRMKNSLGLLGRVLEYTQQELKNQIKILTSENGPSNCNVKISIYHDGRKQNLLMYIGRSYYPVREEIDNGVKVSLLNLERQTPNAKVINSGYKEKVSLKTDGDKSFETLLINRDGKITEGGKSNVFFVKGDRVYTAPGEFVLRGITRAYIINACKNLGFEVIRTLIGVDSLKDMDGLFISGTSIKVLPVAQVDSMQFKSSTNPTILRIRDVFDKVIEEYVKSHKDI